MEKKETAAILALLSSAYPYAKVSRETAAMYHEVWKDLSFTDCKAAVASLVRTSEMFPSAALVRREVLRQGGLMAPTAGEGWWQVMTMVREVGRYGRPQFANPAVQKAVEAIGWREICDSDNQGVLRAHFFKVYEKLADEHDRSALLSTVGALNSGDATRKAVGSGQGFEADGIQEEVATDR